MKKVIISTSTFKSDQEDSILFINSMVESLSDTYENLEILFRP